MNKLGMVLFICIMVAICYLVMLVVMPVITDIASTTNATLEASHNMSLYPGTTPMVLSTPWILWFAPAFIGMVAVIIVLREQVIQAFRG